LTDGFLMVEAVPTLCSNIMGSALKRAVDNLVSVGSWERVEGGYIVHDYLRHNMSKKQVEADQEAGRQRYRNWLAKQRSNGVGNALATPEQRQENDEKTKKQQPSRTYVRTDVKPTTPKVGSRHSDPIEPLSDVIERMESKFPEFSDPPKPEPT
jgi:hypothetical protein